MRRGALLLALVAACEGAAPAATEAGPRARGSARVGGDVVATVDGHPITLDEVAAAAREAGVAPELALSRLEDEAILAAAAERAGFAGDPEVRRATRRAAVQALLARAVEAQITAAGFDPAELEAALDASPARFDRPERRRSTHALAVVAPGAPAAVAAAAEAWIRALHAELVAAPDPAGALAARRPEVGLPFEVAYEDEPAMAREDAADQAYLDAIFAAAGPGLLADPVRTELGWHAVVVTEVVPAWHPSRDEALTVLRDERVAALRARRMEELVRELGARAGVHIEGEAMRRAFADPSLLGGGE